MDALLITIDEMWVSVSAETDFEHLQDLTDASARCQTYTREVIAAMLVHNDAGILMYLFASSSGFRGYLASSSLSSVSLLFIKSVC